MNLVEHWFSALSSKQLRRTAHRSAGGLIRSIQELIDVHNETGKRYVRVRTADEILASISRSAHHTVDAHGSV